MRRIAILQTGMNNPKMPAHYPDYPSMFRSLIGKPQASPLIELISFPILEGPFFPDMKKSDGFIITGSASGVYEETDWMKKLFCFIRDAHNQRKKIAGFCFGHQAIAVALGGHVVKSEKGWGVGIKKHSIYNQKVWMRPHRNELQLIYMHQDQVVKLPESAVLLSGDNFCPFSAFTIEEHILAMQGHPEFSKEFVKDLISLRTNNIGYEKTNAAINSLSNSHDGDVVGEWIINFFCSS